MLRLFRLAPSTLVVLALPLAGCGAVAESAPGTAHSDGGTTASPITSSFPLGVLSDCDFDTSSGNASLGGEGTLTLSEKGGVITAELVSDGVGPMGAVKLQVTTATTAVALSGQTLLLPSPEQTQNPEDGDAGVPATVGAGALTLVDGNVVLSLATPEVGAVVTCVVPYAPCPVLPPDPTASLPSGSYASCSLSESFAEPDTVTLTRSGGTVTVSLGPQLSMYTHASSFDLDVVAPGVAALNGASSSRTTTPTCGDDGTNASLVLEGDTLFFDVGSDWIADAILCTAQTPFDASAATAVTPGGSDAGTVQAGRDVDACSACRSTELCAAVVFQGDLCMELGSGSGSGTSSFDAGPPECPTGYSYDSGADCCIIDPSTTYECWPMPPSCMGEVDCDCASGVVLLACGEDATCSVTGGSITCDQAGP